MTHRLNVGRIELASAIFTEEICCVISGNFQMMLIRNSCKMKVDMFREKNKNIKIMHEKLNNARIMCNHLKYKYSIKKL